MGKISWLWKDLFSGTILNYATVAKVTLMLGLLWAGWGWLWGLPAPIFAILLFAAFVLTLLVNFLKKNWHNKQPKQIEINADTGQPKTNSIEFYNSRTAMIGVRYGLEHELMEVSRAW